MMPLMNINGQAANWRNSDGGKQDPDGGGHGPDAAWNNGRQR